MQLYVKGENSLEKKLRSVFAIGGNAYATRTIIEKEALGQPTDRVTLFSTGRFYKSFRTKKEGLDLLVQADTIKSDNDLIDVWGKEILGLSKTNIEILRPIAQKIIIDHYTKLLVK